jgi:putative transposase
LARLARLYLAGSPQVARHQALPGSVITQNEGDLEALTRLVVECARAHQFALHAFVVLPAELRLVGTGATESALPLTMQAISRRYVAPFNKRANRRGPLWVSRFRSTVVDAEGWLLPAMASIEHAPSHLGLVADPAHYPWSSYRHHVGLAADMELTDHREYWRLGNTPFERQRVYLAKAAALAAIREDTRLWHAVQTGWALGPDEFVARLSQLSGRRSAPLSRGRPQKSPPAEAS